MTVGTINMVGAIYYKLRDNTTVDKNYTYKGTISFVDSKNLTKDKYFTQLLLFTEPCVIQKLITFRRGEGYTKTDVVVCDSVCIVFIYNLHPPNQLSVLHYQRYARIM